MADKKLTLEEKKELTTEELEKVSGGIDGTVEFGKGYFTNPNTNINFITPLDQPPSDIKDPDANGK